MRTRSQGPSSSDKTRNLGNTVEGEIKMYHVSSYQVTRYSFNIRLQNPPSGTGYSRVHVSGESVLTISQSLLCKTYNNRSE